MRMIEAELHQMLLDSFPGMCDADAQAHIVAEAAAALDAGRRQAKLASAKAVADEEEAMATAILHAMERIAQTSLLEDDEQNHLDASGMSPEQVIRAAARMDGKAWGDMCLVNDADLDAILGTEDIDPYRYDFSDGTGRNERFVPKGKKKHRTDANGG
jgi:hypothetical protein